MLNLFIFWTPGMETLVPEKRLESTSVVLNLSNNKEWFEGFYSQTFLCVFFSSVKIIIFDTTQWAEYIIWIYECSLQITALLQ